MLGIGPLLLFSSETTRNFVIVIHLPVCMLAGCSLLVILHFSLHHEEAKGGRL